MENSYFCSNVRELVCISSPNSVTLSRILYYKTQVASSRAPRSELVKGILHDLEKGDGGSEGRGGEGKEEKALFLKVGW